MNTSYAHIAIGTYSEPGDLGDVFVAPPTWKLDAACRGLETKMWFPDTGVSHGAGPAQARRICATCPVQAECLEYSLERHEFGIWAGVSEKQRKHLRATRARERAA